MSESESEQPLLEGVKIGKSTFFRHDPVELSYYEVESLITSLDDITDTLTHHLIGIENESKKKAIPGWTKRPKRCPRLRLCVRKFAYKLTGAKGISFTVILQLVFLVLLTLVDNLPRTDEDKKLAQQIAKPSNKQKTFMPTYTVGESLMPEYTGRMANIAPKTMLADYERLQSDTKGSIGMMVLQIANIIIVIVISGNLAKQVKRRKVSGILLIQSYVATILLFAGLYTATFRFQIKSWKFLEEDMIKSPALIVEIFCRFLFFSVSTATLCGSGDAFPTSWYTSIFTAIQMLLSYMYFTSIIGTALLPLAEMTSERTRHIARELRSLPYRSLTEIVSERRRHPQR